MKKALLFNTFFVLLASICLSQGFEVGYRTEIFVDASRDNREIETVVFYPADIAGEDVEFAEGIFPTIVFGHGFSMGESDLYQYLWDGLVPEGYICLFPLTEGGGAFSPPWHEEFGVDLRFLNIQIIEEGNNESSFYYGRISEMTAIMGHSMGGKAAYIAAANNTDITTLVSLTAAMSDPPWPYEDHGYDALGLSVPFITVPCLVVDAEIDCVVPEEEGHQVIYNELLTDCKVYVNILGGGHCYMASEGSDCETGEGWLGGNCADDFTITREDQNQTVLDIVLPYFDYMLKDNSNALNDFVNYIETAVEVTSIRDCSMISTQSDSFRVYDPESEIRVYPNPFSDLLYFEEFKFSGNDIIRVYNMFGALVLEQNRNDQTYIDLSGLHSGVFILKYGSTIVKIVKE